MPKPDKDITRKENYRTTMQEHRSGSQNSKSNPAIL